MPPGEKIPGAGLTVFGSHYAEGFGGKGANQVFSLTSHILRWDDGDEAIGKGRPFDPEYRSCRREHGWCPLAVPGLVLTPRNTPQRLDTNS